MRLSSPLAAAALRHSAPAPQVGVPDRVHEQLSAAMDEVLSVKEAVAELKAKAGGDKVSFAMRDQAAAMEEQISNIMDYAVEGLSTWDTVKSLDHCMSMSSRTRQDAAVACQTQLSACLGDHTKEVTCRGICEGWLNEESQFCKFYFSRANVMLRQQQEQERQESAAVPAPKYRKSAGNAVDGTVSLCDALGQQVGRLDHIRSDVSALASIQERDLSDAMKTETTKISALVATAVDYAKTGVAAWASVQNFDACMARADAGEGEPGEICGAEVQECRAGPEIRQACTTVCADWTDGPFCELFSVDQ